MLTSLAALPARLHISVFLAALRASGAAAWPELMLPLYRSMNFMQACLQFRLPIRSVAEGLGASQCSAINFIIDGSADGDIPSSLMEQPMLANI
jgi:hypothetical protein